MTSYSMRFLAANPHVFAELEEGIEERWLYAAGEDPDEAVRCVDPDGLPADVSDFVPLAGGDPDVPF